MYFIFTLILKAAAGLLAVLPFLLILEILSARLIPCLSLKHLIGDGIFCFFLGAVLSITGVPALYQLHLGGNINLIPFADLTTNALQYIENLLLFLPVGFLLPLLFPAFQGLKRCALFGFFFSLSVELLQLLSFRATDIDDLIMNTLGTVCGFGCFLLLRRLYPAADTLFSVTLQCYESHPVLRYEAAVLTAIAWAGALLLIFPMENLIWGLFG